jgi:DNA-binding CsgD family transcriptional regulator
MHMREGSRRPARRRPRRSSSPFAAAGVAAFWATTALGLLELSLGNNEEVVTTLAVSIELVEELGLVEPGRQPFLPDAIEAYVRLGELERAERLTELQEKRGRKFGRAWAIVTGARCRALVLAARGDVAAALDGLERVLTEQPPLPIPLDNARTLLVRGQLERRRKQKRLAGKSLRCALEICEEIGAALWAERVRAEMQRLGRIQDPDDLTATEARVATLAASGLTNREIAASAFMSQKTVEANLSRIYRKLGIRSRAELGLRLAEREPA